MKDLLGLIREAHRQGWRVKLSGGSHYKLYAPDRKSVVVIAGSASDERAYANTLARMRRAGFNG